MPLFREEKLPPLDIEKYLQRIGIGQQEPPSLAFLKKVHLHHMLHVPFENLDIHWGREILLDYQRIYRKIVEDRRGGFCYELNGLLFAMLTKLGFNCYIVSARMPKGKDLSPDYEHMAVLTQLEGKVFLCDVGHGKGFMAPLRVVSALVQMDFNKFYRVVKEGDIGWWMQESDDGLKFESKYLFSPKRRNIIEFIERCRYQQTDPKSHFKDQKMITQATVDGRVTLTDKMLIVHAKGHRNITNILNNDDFEAKLQQCFGIHHF